MVYLQLPDYLQRTSIRTALFKLCLVMAHSNKDLAAAHLLYKNLLFTNFVTEVM